MNAELPLLGVGLPVSAPWADAETTARTARRAEELGYSSLWTFQRVLYPIGSDLPRSHLAVHDSAVALAYVAGQTERIGLGTATVCAPLVAPVLLAKTMSSLDVLSGGRLTIGLGMGSVPEEYEAAGVPYERRGSRFEEYLRCLQALWTEDPVEFRGEFYSVPRSHFAPLPTQRPHPPLLLGGTASAALRRAGRMAGGWIGRSSQDPEEIKASVRLVRASAAEAGRDPDDLRVVVRSVPDLLEADGGPRRRPFQGGAEQVRDDLVALRSQGVTEVLFDLNLSPEVGFSDVGVAAAGEYAARVIESLAPAALQS